MAVKQGFASATSQVLTGGPATLLNVWVVPGTAAGRLTLHNATSTATTSTRLLQLNTPAATGGVAAPASIRLGGGGMRFSTAIYGVLSNTGGVTILYATGVA